MPSGTPRMPAEWEVHDATWLAWPYLESDFPGKLSAVRLAYVQLIRHLVGRERVHLLCATSELRDDAARTLARESVGGRHLTLDVVPYHRTWLRDSGPTAIYCEGKCHWVQWKFNAWAKYDDVGPDSRVGHEIARISGLPLLEARRPDSGEPAVLEGGAFDVDGKGTLLATRECLLSPQQERNPGLTQVGYEQLLREQLGITSMIWLEGGCEGDDTHGHIDDIARFVAPGVVCLAMAHPYDKLQYEVSLRNRAALESARDAQGNSLTIVELPYPDALFCDGERLPASYLNFYFANELPFGSHV